MTRPRPDPLTAAELAARDRRPARPARSRSPRRTWTGSPRSTATSTRSCTSTPTARWRRPRPSTRSAPRGSSSRPLAGVPLGAEGRADHTRACPPRRFADPRGLDAAVRRDGRRSGCKEAGIVDPRQDQHGRVRDGLLDRELGVRPDPQPVGPEPHPGRFGRRFVGGDRGVRGAARDRHGHRRLDPPAGRGHRHGRRQADVRRGVALRPDRAGRHRWTRPARARGRCWTPRCCTRSIAGYDPMDSTSIDQPVPPVVAAARNGDVEGVRIGVVKELGGEGYQAGVEARFHEAVELLTKLGAEVVEVSCPHFVYALPAYYLILPSEASSNLARFDAMRGCRRGHTMTSRETLIEAAEKDIEVVRPDGKACKKWWATRAITAIGRSWISKPWASAVTSRSPIAADGTGREAQGPRRGLSQSSTDSRRAGPAPAAAARRAPGTALRASLRDRRDAPRASARSRQHSQAAADLRVASTSDCSCGS